MIEVSKSMRKTIKVILVIAKNNLAPVMYSCSLSPSGTWGLGVLSVSLRGVDDISVLDLAVPSGVGLSTELSSLVLRFSSSILTKAASSDGRNLGDRPMGNAKSRGDE